MTITTTQKVITIGTSAGVTLPAKDLKQAGIKAGDQIDITVRKHQDTSSDDEVLAAAKDILKRYKKDLKNLADR